MQLNFPFLKKNLQFYFTKIIIIDNSCFLFKFPNKNLAQRFTSFFLFISGFALSNIAPFHFEGWFFCGIISIKFHFSRSMFTVANKILLSVFIALTILPRAVVALVIV